MLPAILTERLQRLARKAREIRLASGSNRRALKYIVKYIALKLPILSEAIWAKVFQRSIVSAHFQRVELDEGLPTICIYSTGSGLGDDINNARFMRDLVSAIGPLHFDVACVNEARSRLVYANIPGFRTTCNGFLVDRLAPNYSLTLELSHVANIRSLAPDNPKTGSYSGLNEVVARLTRFNEKQAPLISGLPYTSGYFGRQAVFSNETRRSYLHFQAGVSYGGDQLDLQRDREALRAFGLRRHAYVTVHNGFDPAFVITHGQATRCYPHFAEVISALKAMDLTLPIVQVGAKNSLPIRGVDVQLIGKTSLPELAGLIEGAALHLDNESGVVHLASAVGTQSCVVFGPTDADYFAYPTNVNLRPPFCGGCWWTNSSWMDQCPRGFSEARCMSLQPPVSVANAALAVLRDRSSLNPQADILH